MDSLKLNSAKALYMQIKDRIKEKVLSGELKEGEKIPSERELCEMFGVSRITVRQAIKEAIEEGLLFSVQGKGTFVAQREDAKIDQSLIEFTNFRSTLATRGLTAGTEILGYKILPVDLALGKILNLDITDQILNLNLLGTADGEPFVLYHSYFQVNLGQIFLQEAEKRVEEGIAFSTFDLYNFIDGVEPDYAEQTFEAMGAEENIAKNLKIEKGAPILLITSIFYDKNNNPIEYKKAYYRANRYKFHIKRRLSFS